MTRRMTGFVGSIVFLSAVLLVVPIGSAALAQTFPITPSVLTYSDGFLENLDCAHLPAFGKLSVNQMQVPLTAGNPQMGYTTVRSTQAERQAMVWKRLLVCQVDAQAAVQRAVDDHAAELPPTTLATLRQKLASATAKLSGGMLLYGRQLQQVLFAPPTASCCIYALGDTGYPWTYPGDADIFLSDAVKILAKAGIAPAWSDDLRLYVTRFIQQTGWSDPSATVFVTNKNSYYAGTLSDDARAALEATNDLHMQVADAGVCIRFGGTNCGDMNALRAQLKAAEIYATRQFGLPLIAFYSQAVAQNLSDQEYCVSVQRAHRAYTAWMEAVRDRGNTQQGFRDAWMASIAHAYIHAWRAMGVNLPPLIPADANYNPPGLNPGFPTSDQRLPIEIRQYIYAVVPGIVGGQCNPEG